MIGIVIIGHADFSKGMRSAIELLAGNSPQLETLDLYPGDNPLEFKNKAIVAIDSVNMGDGVLVLIDLFGGTPCNTVAQLLESKDIYAVAGINLPLAIQAVFARDEMSIEELARNILETGRTSLIDVRTHYQMISENSEEENF
ncbi:PTS sugar transporter subunit IIA [Atopobium sp. oral taxon 199]|uniref:PTS sugar transporter subunit IIA n=1 Tax=Atopobium sp. oral taxon 199 TaxID=712156 RepID=UPI00034E16D4|nr:PTS sugar transporter subunit IIA [Atopobium sp. oral taxon 199]EPD78583.1 hypothetical protein HMPREF1527_00907 [Atopobium sp. oral taxon 199 str. F0494]